MKPSSSPANCAFSVFANPQSESASRLETHTKVAQRTILIDQATRSALSEGFTVELLGPVPFKGKAAAVEVFSVDPKEKH